MFQEPPADILARLQELRNADAPTHELLSWSPP